MRARKTCRLGRDSARPSNIPLLGHLSRLRGRNIHWGDARRGVHHLHVVDNVLTELGALDLRRVVHQAREIVGDAFARDRAIQAFDD